MIWGGSLSTRRLGERLLFWVRNNSGDWWEERRDFQKPTTAATATAMASVIPYIRVWCLRATDRRLGATAAGTGIRVSPVWTTGGNQINLGTGVACTSLIELPFMFGKFWVEEVFTGGSRVCPVAPVCINPVVVTLGIGIEKCTGPAYKFGDSSATSNVCRRLCWWRGTRAIRGLRCEADEATLLNILLRNGARNHLVLS